MNMTRREYAKEMAALSLGAAIFPLIGCSTSGLITALDVTEVACAAAEPFLSQLGPEYAVYISGISAACSKSVTELGNTADSQTTQYLTIAGYFVAVATVNLPSGSEVSAIIGAVIAAVQIILHLVNKAPAPTPTPVVAAKLKIYHAQAKALGSDKARMADVLERHQQLKLKLAR